MVCKKCEKKLTTLATSDPFAKSSSNTGGSSGGGKASSSSSSAAAGPTRKINENKLLSSKAKFGGVKGGASGNKFMPYESKCKICKQRCHQMGSRYCQACSYKNGICAMCGISVLDTSGYKMASK
ncbi:PDZ-binding protein [Geranomyces variabilis]|nr:PDZ-binding protein [Geranomyces variabilis]KAJ3142372.1 hypothetical protein HDU90_004645 [Geranomyces variabilis]